MRTAIRNHMRELIYGRNAVYECLSAGRRDVFKLMVAEGAQEKGALAQCLQLAQERRTAVQRAPRAQLDRVSEGHQGVVAEVSGYPYVTLDDLLNAHQPPLFLILDCIQDPQNLGTLLRTAEAVGVSGVIIAQDRAASVTPAVVNASSGATEHVKIARVTNITRALETLKQSDAWIVGLEDMPSAQDYTRADLCGPVAIVVGSEGQGIRRLVRETCDVLVKLPMLGKITSLNASVAGSILLYETLRQRKSPKK
jgi:23S rRNA (guanosine2251-2'-O)-methyltransferase